jgi:hypothetical protein
MMMTKRKTSLLALGATATLMALAPTAVNADAYGNTAHSCEYLSKIKECALLGTEATCGADTSCLWTTEDGDSFCGTTPTVQQNFVTATVPPADHAEVTAVGLLVDECDAKAQADCTGSCEWRTTPTAFCGISEAGIKSKITNTLGALNLYRANKCSAYTSEADCNANSAICEWADATCEANVSVEEYLATCDISLSPASRLTKVSAVVSAVFVAALASLA